VSVFSFTLLGSCVQACDPNHFSGPFVTYVREDDDYDTLARRMAAVTGEHEAEWSTYRLAVVHNRTPYHLQRAAATDVAAPDEHSQQRNESQHQQQQCHGPGATKKAKTVSVWQSILDKFPDAGSGKMFLPNDMFTGTDAKCAFPTLGIQRSVAANQDAQAATRNHATAGRRAGASIKISG